MKETVDAIYENGVLRPLKRLSLQNGRKLRITFESPADEAAVEDNDGEDAVLDIVRLAGSLSGSPRFSDDPLTLQKKMRDEWS
jgi:predicted DNA-binding antitoxin AbrB/MazE fold protein